MDCSPPGSSVHGILQQEHWSGESFPSPGDRPNPGIKASSPALQADALLSLPWMISSLLVAMNLELSPTKCPLKGVFAYVSSALRPVTLPLGRIIVASQVA